MFGILLTHKYAAKQNHYWGCPINHFPMSHINTHLRYISPTIPSKMDSTILVQRAWQKIWLVHMGRNSGTCFSSRLLGRSFWQHRRQIWFWKMPNSLAREMCWLSTGRILQGRVAVRTFCITSRRGPGSSEDDSWIKLWSMDRVGENQLTRVVHAHCMIPWVKFLPCTSRV